MWRDLQPGDTGADVKALQTELARNGAAINPDGVLGVASLRAVRARLVELGVQNPSTTLIERRTIIWLPNISTEVASCPISLGDNVAVGYSVISANAPVTSVKCTGVPPDALPGNRVLVFGETRYPLTAECRITDDALSRFVTEQQTIVRNTLASRPDSSSSKKEGNADTGGFSTEYQLESPIKTWVVPPSALVNVTGTTGCVAVAPDKAIKVLIHGSELGKTFITFPNQSAEPTAVLIQPNPNLTCH